MFTSLPQSLLSWGQWEKSDWGYRDGSVRKVPAIQALCLNFWNAHQVPAMFWVPVTSALSGLVAIRQVDSCSPLASQSNRWLSGSPSDPIWKNKARAQLKKDTCCGPRASTLVRTDITPTTCTTQRRLASQNLQSSDQEVEVLISWTVTQISQVWNLVRQG